MNKDVQYFLNRRRLNIDIGFRCPLQCPKCQRQHGHLNHGMKVPGYDLSLNEIDKISNFYNEINFCGQLSDPIHHPKFIEILKMLYEKKCGVYVHNASSHKPFDYYIKCFKAHPLASWIFGIDGLPEESCLYRINQDGEKLFKIMCESKKYLKEPPTWQYIVFRYNENHIDQAKEMASKAGVKFLLYFSSRWSSDDDIYKPKNPKVSQNAKI